MNKDSSEHYISALGFHIPALDGIRGWAILLVILNHSVMLLPHNGEVNFFTDKVFKYFSMGWMGVDLFFVLSGFLITGILLRTRDNDNYFINFYARRTLRIFPLYYLTIMLFLFGCPLVIDNFNWVYSETVIHSKAIYIFYAQNFLAPKFDINSLPQLLLNPTWSLAVEEHFYLLWPVIVYYCRKRLYLVALLGIIAAIVLRVIFLRFGSPLAEIIYTSTFTRMDSILIGALIAIALKNYDLRHKFNRYKWQAFSVAILAFISMHIFIKFFGNNGIEPVSYTIFALLFGSIVNLILFLPKKDLFVRVFDNYLFRCFGKYSYSMYLFHIPAILIVRRLVINNLEGNILFLLMVLIVASTILVLIISFLTWNCYEKYFLNLKDYFKSDKKIVAKLRDTSTLPIT